MKKLMTMIAAAAMAFGLYAESTIDHTVDFAGLSDGTYDLSQTDGKWGYAGAATNLQIKSEKLEIKTGSDALSRYFIDNSTSADIPADGLFADVEIDFANQALDEVPAVDDNARLGLFILDTSDIEGIQAVNIGTNLYVIGGYGNGGKALYQLTTAINDTFYATPHRVTVKAYNSALSTGARAGFMIYLDGQDGATATPLKARSVYVADQDGKFNLNNGVDVDETQYLGDVTVAPALSGWAAGHQLFLSLKANDNQKLSAIDFVGNATLDNITLTDQGFAFIPADASAMSVSLSGGATLAVADVVGAIYNGTDTITVPNGVTSFTIKPTFTKEITSVTVNGGEPLEADDGVYTITFVKDATIAISQADKVAEITIDDVTTKYSDLATALTDLQSADVATLKLFSSDTIDSIITVGSDVTIDLNGQTITGTGASAGAVIYVSSGKTTVIDTATGGKVVPSDDSIMAAICEFAAELDITAGIFDGVIVANEGEPSATISISGGSFVGDAAAFPYTDWLAARKVATYDGEKYWVVGDQPSAGFVIQVVGNITTNESEGTYTFTCSNNMKMFINGVEQDSAASFTPEAWYAEKQYVVVSEVLPASTYTGKKWYEGLGAVASNATPYVGIDDYGGFHGGLDGDYLAMSYGTAGKATQIWKTSELLKNGTGVAVWTTTKAELMPPESGETYPGNDMRGVGLSKVLNVALAGNYGQAPTGSVYSLPLDATPVLGVNAWRYQLKDGEELIDVDSIFFSADGKYVYSNYKHAEDAPKVAKWEVLNGLKGENGGLRLIDTFDVGTRVRAVSYAKINGVDYVFALLNGDAGIVAVNMTGDDSSQWKNLGNITGTLSTKASYGTIALSGLAAGTPHLTLAGSINAPANEYITVYDLEFGDEAVTATAKVSFSKADLEAAGFGVLHQHCNSISVTDDEKTMFFAHCVKNDYMPEGQKIANSWIFAAEYTEYATLTLNDEKAAEAVVKKYRKGAEIAAPAPATEENFVGWFTDSTKETAAVFPLTLNADTELWAKYEAAGPIPDPEKKDCEMQKESDGSYTVTPVPGKDTVTITGASDSDVFNVTAIADVKISVNAGTVNAIVNGCNINAFIKGGTPIDTALDDAKVKAFVDDKTAMKFEMGDSKALTVKAIPGLTYSLMEGDDVTKELATQAAKYTCVAADDGKTVTLEDEADRGAQAFYTIKVSKEAAE